jgi:O-antigen/teichoic acid export membrane protein
MSTTPKRLSGPARVLAHLRTPLYRNAYAWLVSTGLSSGLGILYWVLAARLYSPEVVGFSAALVSSMIFIAGVSQLNLMSALVRFIPNAGRHTTRLTAGAYGISIVLALIISAIFAALSNRISGLDFFRFDLQLAVLFSLATMAWSVFNLQDAALTGLRASVWVPADNILYAVSKIALLFWLAPRLPEWGIFVSWIAPAIVLILPFNVLIFRWLIPRHLQAAAPPTAPFPLRQLTRYIASNYLGSLFSLTSGRLLPTLVVAMAGPTAAAYFYLAWTISNSLKLATVQMATSLTVEGALDRATIALDGSKFLRLMIGLFVPAILVLVVGAPLLLRLSGPSYAAEGAGLLRLLSLAIIPNLVVSWYLSIARIRHQLRAIIFAEGALALLTLGLSYPLLQRYGVVGVGVAALTSAMLVTLALLPRIWPTLRPQAAPAPAGGLDAAA